MATRNCSATIRYIEGDATEPVGSGLKIVAHICNDIGKWGKGFVLSISHRWKEPERIYREAFRHPPLPVLGDVQFVSVSNTITVANMIAQHGTAIRNGSAPPIRYEAVRAGLSKLADRALTTGSSVHMPRIGCGLAGGEWSKIEPIIAETLADKGIEVIVYNYS